MIQAADATENVYISVLLLFEWLSLIVFEGKSNDADPGGSHGITLHAR